MFTLAKQIDSNTLSSRLLCWEHATQLIVIVRTIHVESILGKLAEGRLYTLLMSN